MFETFNLEEMIIVETEADIARELMNRYSLVKKTPRMPKSKDKGSKKNNKDNVFIIILEDLFSKYGERFGYTNFSDFKSNIIRSKNNIKKSRKVKINTPDEEEAKFWHVANMKPIYHPREGDGEIFTADQINRFDLNHDSY